MMFHCVLFQCSISVRSPVGSSSPPAALPLGGLLEEYPTAQMSLAETTATPFRLF